MSNMPEIREQLDRETAAAKPTERSLAVAQQGDLTIGPERPSSGRTRLLVQPGEMGASALWRMALRAS